MNVVITTAGGESHTFVCDRYMTDEHNNLVVFDGDVLRALYTPEEWRRAVTEEV